MTTPDLPKTATRLVLAAQYKNGEKAKKISHATRVAHAVNQAGFDQTFTTVALLHDIIEASTTTLDDLTQAGFPPDVVDAVDALSQRDGEKRKHYLHRVRHNPLAIVIKWFDMQDHLHHLNTLPSAEASADRLKYREDRIRLYGKPISA